MDANLNGGVTWFLPLQLVYYIFFLQTCCCCTWVTQSCLDNPLKGNGYLKLSSVMSDKGEWWDSILFPASSRNRPPASLRLHKPRPEHGGKKVYICHHKYLYPFPWCTTGKETPSGWRWLKKKDMNIHNTKPMWGLTLMTEVTVPLTDKRENWQPGWT